MNHFIISQLDFNDYVFYEKDRRRSHFPDPPRSSLFPIRLVTAVRLAGLVFRTIFGLVSRLIIGLICLVVGLVGFVGFVVSHDFLPVRRALGSPFHNSNDSRILSSLTIVTEV